MKKISVIAFFLLCVTLTSWKLLTSPNQIAEKTTLVLERIGGQFTTPVAMDAPSDGSGRIFICEQKGLIWIIKNGKKLDKPFLDLSQKVVRQGANYSERGLLGLAFHPQYKTNKRFFVYYSATSKASSSDHRTVISEFKTSDENLEVANLEETIILTYEQPESNHNGGQLAFGPDGYLYIGSGDGGGGGDKHGKTGNAQNLSNLLGKILRIDVNGKKPYTIPSDNPFVGKESARGEIYAYGLRNPWRFSFDKITKRLFCGDVGQNKYEETDLIEKGKNYGWRKTEGLHCFEENCSFAGIEKPIDEYDRNVGNSICGGYMYRGAKIKSLAGKYIFGDLNGKIMVLTEQAGKWERSECEVLNETYTSKNLYLNSFGEDAEGEIYVLAVKDLQPFCEEGYVFKISSL